MSKPLSKQLMLTRLYHRIMKHVEKDKRSGCWLFKGPLSILGYGLTSYGRKGLGAHRGMWMAVHGDPGQFDVCHSCDVRNCVNPNHLWLGVHTANMRDMVAKGRHYLTKRTHCPRGHELSGDNVYKAPNTNKRQCRACNRIRMRMDAGWPENLAVSLDRVEHGQRPVNINLRKRKNKGPRTHCKNGHELVGDAVYITPGKLIECKICRRSAALRWLNRQRPPKTATVE